MGGKSLAIVPSYEGETALPGDYLRGEIESDLFSSVTEKLNPLQAKVESVIKSAMQSARQSPMHGIYMGVRKGNTYSE